MGSPPTYFLPRRNNPRSSRECFLGLGAGIKLPIWGRENKKTWSVEIHKQSRLLLRQKYALPKLTVGGPTNS